MMDCDYNDLADLNDLNDSLNLNRPNRPNRPNVSMVLPGDSKRVIIIPFHVLTEVEHSIWNTTAHYLHSNEFARKHDEAVANNNNISDVVKLSFKIKFAGKNIGQFAQYVNTC